MVVERDVEVCGIMNERRHWVSRGPKRASHGGTSGQRQPHARLALRARAQEKACRAILLPSNPRARAECDYYPCLIFWPFIPSPVSRTAPAAPPASRQRRARGECRHPSRALLPFLFSLWYRSHLDIPV